MGSLSKSKKNIDAEIMYEMRRQGMTNKQIAGSLGVYISTVYNYIGRKSEAVKHAEVQNKPPVVDKAPNEAISIQTADAIRNAVTKAENPPFRPCSVRTAEEKALKEKKPLLALLSAKYTLRGSVCQYILDTDDETVEMIGGIVTGLLDRETISQFVDELNQVREMLERKEISA